MRGKFDTIPDMSQEGLNPIEEISPAVREALEGVGRILDTLSAAAPEEFEQIITNDPDNILRNQLRGASYNLSKSDSTKELGRDLLDLSMPTQVHLVEGIAEKMSQEHEPLERRDLFNKVVGPAVGDLTHTIKQFAQACMEREKTDPTLLRLISLIALAEECGGSYLAAHRFYRYLDDTESMTRTAELCEQYHGQTVAAFEGEEDRKRLSDEERARLDRERWSHAHAQVAKSESVLKAAINDFLAFAHEHPVDARAVLKKGKTKIAELLN
jgi:hypothetical protein